MRPLADPRSGVNDLWLTLLFICSAHVKKNIYQRWFLGIHFEMPFTCNTGCFTLLKQGKLPLKLMIVRTAWWGIFSRSCNLQGTCNTELEGVGKTIRGILASMQAGTKAGGWSRAQKKALAPSLESRHGWALSLRNQAQVFLLVMPTYWVSDLLKTCLYCSVPHRSCRVSQRIRGK